MTPTYKLLNKIWGLKDRGTVHEAELTCSCTWDDVSNLIGTELFGNKIIAVERHAVYDQSYKKVGLLIGKKFFAD